MTSPTFDDLTTPALRRALKRQRAHQSSQQQQYGASRMVRYLRHTPAFRRARHIALYHPVRGEADPRALAKAILPHQTLYLPVLAPGRRGELWFMPWLPNTRFRLNRFRIPEPVACYTQQRPARWLDWVVTPLLAFDAHGSRLGMGGGFYDRTFAFKRRQHVVQRPWLIGYAFAFQQVRQLQRQIWDVPLDAAVTENGWQYFTTSRT